MATAALERPVDRRLRTLAPLVVDDGCDVRVRGGVHDAVRVALLEWLPLTVSEVRAAAARLEDDDSSADALAALIRPPTIWTLGEALVADPLPHVDEEHLSRLRVAATRLKGQLPVAGCPGVSAAVARGCDAVAADDGVGEAVARALVARYAGSAFVAARRREAAPTMT